MFRTTIVTTLTLLLVLNGISGIGHADEEGRQMRAILEENADSIVTINVVLKREMSFMGQSREQESRMELHGVVVDSSGLIMTTSAPFESSSEAMGGMGGMGGGSQFDMKVTPTDFKITFGREDKEYTAFLVATDSKYSLGFLQIEELGDRELSTISFAGKTKPQIGDKVISINRLDKGYDYAPFFSSTRISGQLRKPRKAWMIDGGLGGMGLPVFTPSGEVLGVLAHIDSGVKAEGEGGMGGMMGRLGAMFGTSLGGAGSFIVPSRSIQSILGQALKKAGDLLEGENKSKPRDNGSEKKPDSDSPRRGGGF